MVGERAGMPTTRWYGRSESLEEDRCRNCWPRLRVAPPDAEKGREEERDEAAAAAAAPGACTCGRPVGPVRTMAAEEEEADRTLLTGASCGSLLLPAAAVRRAALRPTPSARDDDMKKTGVPLP